jgi:hypothetical protein
MIARRLVLGAALLPLAGRAALSAPGAINFRILRQGSAVGTHAVRFRDDGDLLRVRSEMRIRVTLAGFTVFRFTQDTEEAWRGDRLAGLESRADRNGKPGFCSAVAEAGGLRVRGVAGQALLPANAAPLTWWRAATLLRETPLFDVREGIAVSPRVERVAQAGGQRIRLIGGEGAEVAYDAAGNWTFFATTGEDGSTVTYERA